MLKSVSKCSNEGKLLGTKLEEVLKSEANVIRKESIDEQDREQFRF